MAAAVASEPTDGLEIVEIIVSIPSTNVSVVVVKVIVAVELPLGILNVVAPVA